MQFARARARFVLVDLPIGLPRDLEPVAAIGLAGGADLPAKVTPFILRGVNLLGINSVTVPYAKRLTAWQRIAAELPMAKLEGMIHPATLADLPALGAAILQGQVQGRVVVDVNA